MKSLYAILWCVPLVTATSVRAQDAFELVWATLDGGGGAMSGDGFELVGTTGQPDVSTVLTGGGPESGGAFSLHNGYWVPGAGVPTCAADFNDDGSVDFFDYDDFVLCFEGGACPPGKSADFNNDSSIDFFDYDDFVIAFDAGCP